MKLRRTDLIDRLPDRFHYPLDAVFVLSHFHQKSILQRLIHKLKYEYRPDIGIELGRILSSGIPGLHTGTLIPVPQTPSKRYYRGYNQAELLARGISHNCNIPVNVNLLKRSNQRRSQTKMNRMGRFMNMRASLDLNMEVKVTEPLWLVDDVVTTGATLNACLELLVQGGYKRMGILVMGSA